MRERAETIMRSLSMSVQTIGCKRLLWNLVQAWQKRDTFPRLRGSPFRLHLRANLQRGVGVMFQPIARVQPQQHLPEPSLIVRYLQQSLLEQYQLYPPQILIQALYRSEMTVIAHLLVIELRFSRHSRTPIFQA